ncbi:MAG TPA: cytochrome c [Bryobacteraceae bacterium]|jgi:ubiquinol-cytochrome c reductase cytochrome c subunit
MNRFLLAICAVATAMLLPGLAFAQQGPAGDAAKGKELFLMTFACYSCHGFDAHGGAGARLSQTKMTQAAFTSYVRNPVRMPPYSAKVLSDAQLADIYAYVKSVPDSPQPKSVPLLNQILSEK